MKIAIATAIVLSLSACSALPRARESVAAEVVFQTANAVDWSQTINTARRPDCYVENDPVTRAMFGQHPSSGEVGAAWALQATLHLAISGWLDRQVEATDAEGWRAVRIAWQILTIVNAGKNIRDNHSVGLRPFGKADICRGVK